jgi:hypothetical protein
MNSIHLPKDMETSSGAIDQIVATMAATYYTNLIHEVLATGKPTIEEINYEAGLHYAEITSISYPGVTVAQTTNTETNEVTIDLLVLFTEETVGITKVAEFLIDEDEEVNLYVYVQPLKVQCQLIIRGVETQNLYNQVEETEEEDVSEDEEDPYQLDEALTAQSIVDGIKYHMKEIDELFDLFHPNMFNHNLFNSDLFRFSHPRY